MSIDNQEGDSKNVQTSEEHSENGITSIGVEVGVEVGKKRGRPKGSKGKEKGTPSQFRNYQPKRWEEWMEAVCMESACGKSNVEIGVRYGYTAQHISNILSSDKAKEVKLEIIGRIKKGQEEISIRLQAIREKAIERIANFVDNEQYAQASPFNHVKLSMDAFRLTNAPDTNVMVGQQNIVNNNTQNNILVANPEILKRLAKGLEVSNEARMLNSSNSVIEDAVVIKEEKLKVG